MGASKISLKLLIDTNNNKVVFAEAGKNCVDFLFHLLSLPLGTAVRLLRKQQMIGSLENLYDSIENLDEAYIQPNQNKDIFLSPKSPAGTPAPAATLLALGDKSIDSKAFYTCSNSCSFSSTSRSSTTFGTVAFGSSSSSSFGVSSAPSAPSSIFSPCFGSSFAPSFSSTPSVSSSPSAPSFSSTPSAPSFSSAFSSAPSVSSSPSFGVSSAPSAPSSIFSPCFGSSSAPSFSSAPSVSSSPSFRVSSAPSSPSSIFSPCFGSSSAPSFSSTPSVSSSPSFGVSSPPSIFGSSSSPLLSSAPSFSSSSAPYFGSTPFRTARYKSKYVSDDPRAVCPQCSRTMSWTGKYVAPPPTGGAGDINESGFVKGMLTYMIMDDLEVKPMSTISSITLVNNFNVKNRGALKEKAVDLGMNEALKLLKASLESKTVLTDVFLDEEDKQR